eukprot:13040315-Ditylum_brightwellii.AAC.1
MNDEKKEEQLNMAQNDKVSALKQQLAEMRALIESIQKGQPNVSFPTANAVAHQPMMMMSTPMQQWQQPFANITNVPFQQPQAGKGGRKKCKEKH